MNSHLLRALSIRPFFLLWIGELFSQISFNMVNFILIIVAFEIARSNTAVSGIVLAFTVPAIIFGIIAGVYVDRWNKKNVLVVTNIIRAVLLIFLAFFYENLFLVYLITFLISLVTQFFVPAETPIIPLLVKKPYLLSANALFGMGIYISVFIGYAFSGVFLSHLGKTLSFLLLSLFFLLSSFFISFISVSNSKKQSNANNDSFTFTKLNLRDEIKNAYLVISKTGEVYYSFLLLILSQMLVLILAVIGPGFAEQVLKIHINDFPFLFVAPAAFGMVIGGIILGNYFHNRSRRVMVDVGIFLSSIILFTMPYTTKVVNLKIIIEINKYLPSLLLINLHHFLIFLAFFLGVANSLVFIPSNTLLQEGTSDQIRGKVYGALNALVGIFSLIPIILIGGLADVFGVSQVLIGLGFILFIFGIIRLTFKK